VAPEGRGILNHVAATRYGVHEGCRGKNLSTFPPLPSLTTSSRLRLFAPMELGYRRPTEASANLIRNE
jgi:hypothetical protein